MCEGNENCNKLHLQARDGRVWTIDEILENGVMMIRQPRDEAERFAEKTISDHWGYITPNNFQILFGCTPMDILQGWV